MTPVAPLMEKCQTTRCRSVAQCTVLHLGGGGWGSSVCTHTRRYLCNSAATIFWRQYMLKTLNTWNTSKVKSAFTLESQVTFWSISSLPPPQKTPQPRGPLQDGTKKTGRDVIFGITCYTGTIWTYILHEIGTTGLLQPVGLMEAVTILG